jgi:hypothetical protein
MSQWSAWGSPNSGLHCFGAISGRHASASKRMKHLLQRFLAPGRRGLSDTSHHIQLSFPMYEIYTCIYICVCIETCHSIYIYTNGWFHVIWICIYIYIPTVYDSIHMYLYIYVIFNYPIILYNLLCIPYMYNSAANMEIGQLTGTLSRTDKELDRDSGQ